MENKVKSRLCLIFFIICIIGSLIMLGYIIKNIEYAKNDPCGACEKVSGLKCYNNTFLAKSSSLDDLNEAQWDKIKENLE